MSDETKTYGIDELKKVLETAFEVVDKVEEALADDGKVSGLEAAGIAISTIPDAYAIAKKGKLIAAQYKDLDDTEREELKFWFADKFDLDDDIAEEKVEAIFNWLVVTDDTISTLLV